MYTMITEAGSVLCLVSFCHCPYRTNFTLLHLQALWRSTPVAHSATHCLKERAAHNLNLFFIALNLAEETPSARLVVGQVDLPQIKLSHASS